MAEEAAGAAAGAEATGAAATEGAASAATATNVLANAKVAETKAEGAVAEGAKATEAKAGEEGSKAEGAKTADGKAAESKDSKAADAPIEYTAFELPDGMEIDEKALGEAKALFAEEKLPQDKAQKYVSLYANKIKEFGEAQAARWVRQNETWVSDFKADKEIGGDRVNDTVSAAAKAMDRFGTPGLREALIATGAGNHPEVIRFVSRVGKAISEDRFVVATGASGGERSAAEILYPEHGKAKE